MTLKLPETVTLCLGVGAQKAGTTWLAAYFDAHPSVFMSPIKELHYFDAVWLPERMGKRNARHLRQMKDLARDVTLEDARAGANRWMQIGLHYDRVEMFAGGHPKYLEFFAKRVGDRPVAAEVTPSYSLLSADNFREIRAVHPRVKAVYLMRNPIDRAWSALRHRERSGFRIDSRFNRALRAPGLRLRSDYGRTLEALRSAFPAEDLYVEFYERLFTETAIRRLCDFLGIAYHPAPFDRVVNKAKDKVMTADQRQRLGQLLRPVYEYCHQRFGDRLPERWQEDMNFIAQGA